MHETHNHSLLILQTKALKEEGCCNPINQGHQEQWSRFYTRAPTWEELEWSLHSAHHVAGLLPSRESTLYQGIQWASSVLPFIVTKSTNVDCDKISLQISCLIWGKFYEQGTFYFFKQKANIIFGQSSHSILKSLHIPISYCILYYSFGMRF